MLRADNCFNGEINGENRGKSGRGGKSDKGGKGVKRLFTSTAFITLLFFTSLFASSRTQTEPLQQSDANVQQIRKIVVDAGHGGKDPGAVGRKGTKEKEINLLIALELARTLKMEGYEVHLTRSEDVFVPLLDRSMQANNLEADLFVSVHCNASISKKRSGFEIYYLAKEASDMHAESTANFENAVIELEDPVNGKKRKLQELIYSMVQTQFINESSLLCSSISQTVKKRLKIKNREVKQANFHVLHGVQMPSVLIETGFITNPEEEKKLKQKKFRSAIVDAVLAGIQNYEKQVQLLTR